MPYNTATNPSNFAKLRDLKAGNPVRVDGNVGGLNPHHSYVVQEDADGLYLEGKDGKHYLDGQADDNEDENDDVCIGVWLNKAAMAS